MIQNLTVFVLAFALLASACAPVSTGGDESVDSDKNAAPEPAAYDPKLEDSALNRGPVYVDSYDLLTLESFPPQFVLVMRGNLPNPCHQLRVVVSEPDIDKNINIEAYSVADPNIACAEMLQSFEVNIPLGSFKTGKYSILVNGEKVSELDAP